MSTHQTTTLAVTIDAPPQSVAADLADPATHPEWAAEFFDGPATRRDDGSYSARVPLMGGPVRFTVEADTAAGIVDLFLAPEGAPFGAPLPVRLVPNGDGVDVLWTLTRFPGTPDEAWQAGLASMSRELERLRERHESGPARGAQSARAAASSSPA